MSRIELVVCYYGKFPPYFPLWLDSCRGNKILDFLLVTDIDLSDYTIPRNVHVLYEGFGELRNRFQKLFPFDIRLSTPYKLCDFKPVYGLAFREELKDFDFWGYCDIDLIFGDVSKFLTDEILCHYDKIFEYGHFMLYRNTELMRQLFRKKGANFPYTEVYRHEEGFAFDEMFGMDKIAKKNGVRAFCGDYCKNILCSMYGMVSGQRNIKEEIYYKDKKAVYGAVLHGGTVTRTEYMYIHFSQKTPVPTFADNHIPESYYISVNGCTVRTRKGKPTYEEVLNHTDYNNSISKSRAKIQRKLQKAKHILIGGQSRLARKIYARNALDIVLRCAKRNRLMTFRLKS